MSYDDTAVPLGSKQCTICHRVFRLASEHWERPGAKVCVDCWRRFDEAATAAFIEDKRRREEQERAEQERIEREQAEAHARFIQEEAARRKRLLERKRRERDEREEQERSAPYKICRRCHQQFPNTIEFFKERPHGRTLAGVCRACRREPMRRGRQRYQERLKQLPFQFTAADEIRALNYFNGCCAVCQKPLSGKEKTHFDHWIALTDPRPDNPGTVPTNMIPTCSSCNTSKYNYDPIRWLNWKFGPEKAKRIAQRIERYFDWVRTRESGCPSPTKLHLKRSSGEGLELRTR